MRGQAIERIEVKGFQSHAKTVFEPGAGLTVITGPSDQGKSALLRAIRWVYCNEPRGDDYIRVGASEARVTITLRNGTKVTRYRSASGRENGYLVEHADPAQDPDRFEGVGNDVPAEVEDVLGVRPVYLGKETVYLNIAQQLAAPFLISSPGAVRDEAIGRLTNVHVLNEATGGTSSDLRAAKQGLAAVEKQLSQSEVDLAAFSNVAAQDAGVAAFEENVASVREKQKRLATLSELMRRWSENDDRVQGLQVVLDSLSGLEGCTDAIRGINTMTARHQSLISLDSRHERTERAMAGVTAVLGATEGLPGADFALAEARTVARRLDKIRSLETTRFKTEAQLAEARVIMDRTAGIARASVLWMDATTQSRRQETLHLLQSKHQVTESALARIDHVLAITARLPRAEHVVQQLQSGLTRIGGLQGMGARLEHLDRRIVNGKGILERLKNAPAAAEQVEQLRTAIERVVKVRRFADQIADWQQRAKPVNQEIKRQTADHQLASQTYKQALLEIGQCPTCGQGVNPAKLEHLLQHLHIE